MATPVEEVVTKTEKVELEPKTDVTLRDEKSDEAKEEEKEVEIEPKTGVSFPAKLNDADQLNSVGLMKKNMLGMDIKIYAFGMYANNEKLKELLKSKIGKAPEKPTKEMFQVIIDSDVDLTIRMVFVFRGLAMGMLKTNFDESIGESIMKLNDGQKNDVLSKKVLGEASDYTVLTYGSVIEISRLPGYILQTKVLGEEVSKVESELLCRAGVDMYLGDEPTDVDAKEKFGMSLLSLF